MNFFTHQERARKKTFTLVMYFIIAIILIILTIDAIAIMAVFYVDPRPYLIIQAGTKVLNQPALIELSITCTLIVIPIVISIILIGTIVKLISLREGGIAVAEMVEAIPISAMTKDPLERRFVNVVEEMSIASGVRVPKLYIMKNERSVNAFVAGIKPADTVMVVTQGALDHFSRDELQGVIGHEFSHIFNSDMQISLKVMGILGGLLVIGQIGYFILRSLRFSRNNSRSNDGRFVIALMLFGFGLLVIGYIGLFFGRLIKAAISRQRELLADASSIQYTRNPLGIILALKRIQQNESGTHLDSKNAEDISHICFAPALGILFNELLATHPPLEERIRTLDPKGEYANQPLKDPRPTIAENKPKSVDLKPLDFVVLPSLANAQITTSAMAKSIGNPTQESISVAQQLIAQIPQHVHEIAHDPQKVGSILFALVLPEDKEKINQIENILETTEKEMQILIWEMHDLILNLPSGVKLPLLDIALPAFKSNSVEQRRKMMQIVETLVALGDEDLLRFAIHAIIAKEVEEKNPRDSKVKYENFQPVIADISTLIALIINCGHEKEESASRCYDKIIKIFTERSIPEPPIKNFEPIKLQLVLARLNLLSPMCKETLIHACLDCIQNDGIVTLEEAEIIRAIAACLDCPIPVIIPT